MHPHRIVGQWSRKMIQDSFKTPESSLNQVGKENRLAFYNTVHNIPKCTKTQASSLAPSAGTLTEVKNVNNFLFTFVQMYRINQELRESLIMGLLHVMFEKLKGHQNPKLPAKVMNFFVALDATSLQGYDFVSANFLGPALCTIHRYNTKGERPLLINIESSAVINCLRGHIEKVTEGKRHLDITLAFDGTKVPKVLCLSI